MQQVCKNENQINCYLSVLACAHALEFCNRMVSWQDVMGFSGSLFVNYHRLLHDAFHSLCANKEIKWSQRNSPFPSRPRRSPRQRCRRASWSTRTPSTPRLHHSRCCRSPRCSPPASAGTEPAGNPSGGRVGQGHSLTTTTAASVHEMKGCCVTAGGAQRHQIFSQRTVVSERNVHPWCESRRRPRQPAS